VAIGVNWAEVWKPVWKAVWTTTPPVVVDEIESRPHKGRKGEKEPRVLEEEMELFYLIMAIAAGSSEFLH
jgi:hypothetical protein